jgi:two-component system response regulator
VILLDVKMPKVDGIEVLRRIRQDDNLKLTPVVMLTSSAEERDIVESYRLGANSYIVKPIDLEDFDRVVTEIGLYWVLVNKTANGGSAA